MIDFIKQVPTVYSQESRDYQIMAKLYDALFNACKFYSDSILSIHRNKFISVADLKCANSNFFPRRDWENYILDAVSYGFNWLVKNKGTRTAIESCINILLRLFEIPQNHKSLVISGESFLDKTYTEDSLLETNSIVIIIPKDLAQIGIVQDLMRYILPVGVSCRVVEIEIIDRSAETHIDYQVNSVPIKGIKDSEFYIPFGGEDSELHADSQDHSPDKNKNYWYRSHSITGSTLDIPMTQLMFGKVVKENFYEEL